MTDISSNLEHSAPEAGSGRTGKHRSHQSSRRKRSLYSTLNYHLDQMLRMRKIFRAGLVLLPLAGFLHVSLVNNVLGPDDKASDSITTERRIANKDSSIAADAETLKHTRYAPDTPADSTTSELLMSETTATERSISNPNTYVVNEGGSLWRTGRRFIDDEVLLDKLIDNLSESGMNVRSVKAGVEFVVNDLGSKGMLVVIEDDGDTYESRILKDSVTSSVRHQAASEPDSSRTASLKQ